MLADGGTYRGVVARTLRIVAATALLAVAAGPSASTQPAAQRKLIILLAPFGDLPRGVDPAAVGVYPESRNVEHFYREVSAGSPTTNVTGTPGVAGSLAVALKAAGIPITTYGERASLFIYGDKTHAATKSERVVDPPGLLVLDVFGPDTRLSDVIFASGPRTPILIGTRKAEVWVGEVAGRSGVVTPYDVSAWILKHFNVERPTSFSSSGITQQSAVVDVRALAERLERDDTYQQSLTAWTVVVGLGLGFLVALALTLARRREWGARVAVAASTASAGYFIGLFIPHARGDVRAIGVFALFFVVLIVNPKNKQRFAATTFTTLGVCTALVALASAARPDAEPALSFWGNPLVSWRFRGLLNYQAAFIAGGVVAGLVALGATVTVVAVALGAALILTVIPGENFVGVLTLGFGGALAFLALKDQAFKRGHFLIAGVFAGAVFVAALAFDANLGSSHGGEAAQTIARGGLGSLIDVTFDRLRLNWEAILAFPGGIIWAVAFAALFVFMIRWGIKDQRRPLGTRVAIAACSASGLAALVLEDSGFKTSAVMGFPALILWTLSILENRRDPL